MSSSPRLLEEEYGKLLAAGNRDVHDVSKTTTLPIAREIVETYVLEQVKLPWYIDLLNINLDNHDLTEAKRRIRAPDRGVPPDGTRVTENLDFAAVSDRTENSEAVLVALIFRCACRGSASEHAGPRRMRMVEEHQNPGEVRTAGDRR